MQILRLGRLQTARAILKPQIVHNMTERLLPDLPLSDVLMPIHARAEVRFGIVEMEGENFLFPDE